MELYDIKDLSNIAILSRFNTKDDCTICLKFMKQQRILTVGSESIIQIYNINGKLEFEMKQEKRISCIDYSMSQKYILTGSDDSYIRVYSIQKQKIVNELKINYKCISILKCSKISEFVCAFSS